MSNLDDDLKDAAQLAKDNLAKESTSASTAKSVLDKITPKGNTIASQQSNEGRNPFQPDIKVTKAKAGFSSQETTDHLNPDVRVIPPPSSSDQVNADIRPATKIDLAKITEADILNLPFINAKSFDIPAMLQVEPKDPAIRFRWVNFKNYEGGNYAMFKAIGFSNAQPQDVKGDLSENLLKEDGTIKWFDVVLMKVDVFRLMGIYKKNIIRALEQVGRWQPVAIAQAQRTLMNEVGSDILAAMKRAGHTVEFYAPTAKEMSDQDKAFVEGN